VLGFLRRSGSAWGMPTYLAVSMTVFMRNPLPHCLMHQQVMHDFNLFARYVERLLSDSAR
jgi:hypothetical protein